MLRQSFCTLCQLLKPSGSVLQKISTPVAGHSKKLLLSTNQTSAVALYSTKSLDIRYTKYKKFNSKRAPSEHKEHKVSVKEGPNKYQPQSPYAPQVPWKYGYTENFFKGGLLPRIPEDDMEFETKPKYENWDKGHRWIKKRALFGVNDYIDILGDGELHPADFLQGPNYMKGYNKTEYLRIQRRMRMDGPELKELYPTVYQDLVKRKYYLWKKLNYGRKKNKH